LNTPQKRIDQSVDLIAQYGGIDGAHHKTWLVDQILRSLLEDEYTKFVRQMCQGENDEDYYEWNTGTAP
jgi:hypothetical protein